MNYREEDNRFAFLMQCTRELRKFNAVTKRAKKKVRLELCQKAYNYNKDLN